MLITVKNAKLVLGRTVYRKGDVFECRDAEANLLMAGRMVMKSPDGAKATKTPPTAPTTGMSRKPGTPPASQETPAARVTKQPASTPPGNPVGAMMQPQPPQTPPEPAPAAAAPADPAGRPVGAMMQPQGPNAPQSKPRKA